MVFALRSLCREFLSQKSRKFRIGQVPPPVSNDMTPHGSPQTIEVAEEIEHEFSYPSFLVEPSGQAHGVYTYNRKMIKYVSFDFRELAA